MINSTGTKTISKTKEHGKLVQKQQPKVEQNIAQESINIAQQSTKVAPVHIAK